MTVTNKLSLYIAICTLGQVRAQWALCFASQQRPMSRRHYMSALEGFTNICQVRNVAVHMALEKSAEYLMFWDDDVIPHQAHDLLRLLAAMDQHPEATAIGGVYPRRSAIPEPIVIRNDGEGAWWGYEEGGLHKVYLTATGFTMYRLSDLAEMDVPVKEQKNGALIKQFFSADETYSDDFYFAELLRQAGKTWLVHGDVVCDQVDLDGTFYRIEDAKQRLVTA